MIGGDFLLGSCALSLSLSSCLQLQTQAKEKQTLLEKQAELEKQIAEMESAKGRLLLLALSNRIGQLADWEAGWLAGFEASGLDS